MADNCQFAFAVHILAVLAYRDGAGVNSTSLARSVNTNAVVIRRLLSDLRRAGLVCTQRGVAGGARLCSPPREITLERIYHAVNEGARFSHHPHPPNPRCPVGCNIENVLSEVFSSAQTALEQALARRTLADVLENVTEPGATLTKEKSGVRQKARPRIGGRRKTLSAKVR